MLVIAVATVLIGLCCGSALPPKAVADDYKCDQSQSGACLKTFLADLGLQTTPNSSEAFLDYLHQLFKDNGRNGFTALCGSHDKLEFCEGSQYDDCTSVRGLQDLGLSDHDAVSIAAFFARVDYDCTTGFDEYYKNFECIFSVADTQKNEEEDKRCVQTLENNLHHEPDLACEYIQEYMSCITIPYQACGKTATKLICNSLLADFHKLDRRCNDFLSCENF